MDYDIKADGKYFLEFKVTQLGMKKEFSGH